MREAAIRLRFPNAQAAGEAFETLRELGYRPDMAADGDPPMLAVHIEGGDVVSALEIAHAYGGHLTEGDGRPPERIASDPDGTAIPAHVVTEDFPDGYLSGEIDIY